jgi:hypothetical protein
MIWLNNYYIPPGMAKFLKSDNTTCTEATKINRRNLPKEVKEKATEGEVNACCRCPDHNKEEKEKQKSVCVIHCNQCMDGVDKKDQLLQMYILERKRIIVVHKTIPNASEHHSFKYHHM